MANCVWHLWTMVHCVCTTVCGCMYVWVQNEMINRRPFEIRTSEHTEQIWGMGKKCCVRREKTTATTPTTAAMREKIVKHWNGYILLFDLLQWCPIWEKWNVRVWKISIHKGESWSVVLLVLLLVGCCEERLFSPKIYGPHIIFLSVYTYTVCVCMCVFQKTVDLFGVQFHLLTTHNSLIHVTILYSHITIL